MSAVDLVSATCDFLRPDELVLGLLLLPACPSCTEAEADGDFSICYRERGYLNYQVRGIAVVKGVPSVIENVDRCDRSDESDFDPETERGSGAVVVRCALHDHPSVVRITHPNTGDSFHLRAIPDAECTFDPPFSALRDMVAELVVAYEAFYGGDFERAEESTFSERDMIRRARALLGQEVRA